MVFSSDFQYGSRSSQPTADLLTELLYLLTDMGYSTLDISKTFDRVYHAGLLHKLKSYWISGHVFDLISSFPSNRLLQVVLDGKSSQEYPVNVGVP